jgi:hypothetical protein
MARPGSKTMPEAVRQCSRRTRRLQTSATRLLSQALRGGAVTDRPIAASRRTCHCSKNSRSATLLFRGPAGAPGWRPCYASTTMLVRFRQTAAGLQCSLVETHRVDGAVRYEQVASLGAVPASPSVSDRTAFWRRVYETLAGLASRIDAETQGKIISAVHSRVPIVTPSEQRAPRVRSRPAPEKAPRNEGAKEVPQNKPPASGTTDASTLPIPHVASLPTTEQEGMQTARQPGKRSMQVENAKRGKKGFSEPMAVEEFATVLGHLLQHTPFR